MYIYIYISTFPLDCKARRTLPHLHQLQQLAGALGLTRHGATLFKERIAKGLQHGLVYMYEHKQRNKHVYIYINMYIHHIYV